VFIVVVTLFSVAAFWQSFMISGFSGLSTPGIFPMLASATMVISGIFILRKTVSTHSHAQASSAENERFFEDILPWRMVGMLALVAFYVFTMPTLGFVIGSAVFLFAAFSFLWKKNLIVSIALTAFSLASIYFIFRKVFQVVLPQGTLMQGLF